MGCCRAEGPELGASNLRSAGLGHHFLHYQVLPRMQVSCENRKLRHDAILGLGLVRVYISHPKPRAQLPN